MKLSDSVGAYYDHVLISVKSVRRYHEYKVMWLDVVGCVVELPLKLVYGVTWPDCFSARSIIACSIYTGAYNCEVSVKCVFK